MAAVKCALAIEEATERAEKDSPDSTRIRYRIGVHLCEVVSDGDELHGEGLNVANLLQRSAPAGGIALSRIVRDSVEGRLPCTFEDLGERTNQYTKRPVHAFLVRAETAGAVVEAPAQDLKSMPQGKPLLCVLPFANMSDDPQQEYFSDGITEDIITDLNKVSALSVVARSRPFASDGKDVQQAPGRSDFSHLLRGSVRKSGNRLRITAQLSDGVTGEQIWAERYDRELTDIFMLQDEISGAIIKALKVRLLPDEQRAIGRRGTTSSEAYNYCLMARQRYVSGDQGDPQWGEGIVRLSRRATEIDPNYARAWAYLGLGEVARRWALGTSGDDGLSSAERALTLDPTLSEGHVVKARIFMDASRHEDAIREVKIAYRYEPQSWLVNYTAALAHYYAGQFDNAIGYFERATSLDDTDFNAPALLIDCYMSKRDRAGSAHAARLAIEHAENVLANEQHNAHAMVTKSLGLAALGKNEMARELMDKALVIEPDNVAVRFDAAAILIAYHRDIDCAIDMIGPALAKMSPGWLDLVKHNATFRKIGDHPRFKILLAEAEARTK